MTWAASRDLAHQHQIADDCYLIDYLTAAELFIFLAFIGFHDLSVMYSVSQKKSPRGFLTFFPNGCEFFNQFLHVPFCTELQIFIQLSPTLTKLCYTKRNHPTNFYISLEI